MPENEIIRQLYRSRYATTRGAEYHGPVVTLVRELMQLCEDRGLTLSRWQTNSKQRGYVERITWAAHRGEREYRAVDMPETCIIAKIELAGSEGSTEHCDAYKRLLELRAAILAAPMGASNA